MKLREEVWNVCRCCKKRTTLKRAEAYGCDNCHKVIDLQELSASGQRRAYLDATIFRHGEGGTGSDHLNYCSWKCALAHLSTVKTDYFITLPYLTFDGDDEDISARDFWAAVRSFGAPSKRRASAKGRAPRGPLKAQQPRGRARP